MELEGGKCKFLVGNMVKDKLMARISFLSSAPASSHTKTQGAKTRGRAREEQELQVWVLFWALPPAPAPRELSGAPALSSLGLADFL